MSVIGDHEASLCQLKMSKVLSFYAVFLEIVVIHFDLSITEELRSGAAIKILYSNGWEVQGPFQKSIPFQKVLEYMLTSSFHCEVWLKLVENQENYLLCLGPRRHVFY